MIFNPLEDYLKRLAPSHLANVESFFNELLERSRVNVDENRETVKRYDNYRENLSKLKRRFNLLRFLRVLAFITLILIPIAIWVITPKIKKMREDISDADKKIAELLAKANAQMLPLNRLFTDRDSLTLIEKTIPKMRFFDCFSATQEMDMRTNFDLSDQDDVSQSTTDVLAGEYNENPFLFENRLIHTMGTQVYNGYKTISWRESYTDSNGRRQTRVRTQTLHASVVKPKPFYNTQAVLNYGSQGGPELSFSRDATYLHNKSEKQIERLVKRGDKRLKRKTDKAVKQNEDFVSMSNTEFEVLFDALDRTNEVQFRTLFTPLAQTNMVDLILSREGYGDDFSFFKVNRMNKIVAKHSQGRDVFLTADKYHSHSFDITKESFISRNKEFFKAVFFDFAPILAIPIYQERPVHSLKPIPDSSRLYSSMECESLANAVSRSLLVHPDTKTEAILKTQYVKTESGSDKIKVASYSYDIIPRIDVIPVLGGDGRMHGVPVPWDEYIPLQAFKELSVSDRTKAGKNTVLAVKNGLCIFN